MRQKFSVAMSIRRTESSTRYATIAMPNARFSRQERKPTPPATAHDTSAAVIERMNNHHWRPARTARSCRSRTVSESPTKPLVTAVPSVMTRVEDGEHTEPGEAEVPRGDEREQRSYPRAWDTWAAIPPSARLRSRWKMPRV